jgi:hypothetical protein
MIDPTRRELLSVLEELSATCPEYRLGQMLLNLAFMVREGGDRSLWDLEDAELIDVGRKHLEDWHNRHGGVKVAETPAGAATSQL